MHTLKSYEIAVVVNFNQLKFNAVRFFKRFKWRSGSAVRVTRMGNNVEDNFQDKLRTENHGFIKPELVSALLIMVLNRPSNQT